MAKPKEVTDTNFEQEVLKNTKPVLVDFWAPWCGPCRMVAPIVEELADEYAGRVEFVKLNTDDNPLTQARYGVRSIPTLIMFKNGEPTASGWTAEPKSWKKPGIVSSSVRAAPPACGCASKTSTRTPLCARVMAAARPLGPAPTMQARRVL